MDDLDLLLERLRTDPDDPEGRAVLADWLLEHDQPEAVTWLELEDAHHRGVLDLEGRRRFVELDKRVDPDLRTRIARTRVENCTIELRAKFAYPCPERWAEMKPTADPRQRMCAVCDKAVHFVDTVEEARQHAVRDECVAISPAPERHPHDLRPPVPLPGTFMPPPRPPVPGKPFMPPTLDGIPPSPEPHGDVPSEEPPEPPKRSWWQRLFGS
ncbi:MAG: hypothetical protein H6736_09020 [Alphaproteobacteria bacterium]|nr:hypothetical protein [Alphaproteobacteria bacterium]MCB9691944.1 hypothetical protein [Alphaproteobacteria bacterium]